MLHITRDDGLITREVAAALCGVTPDAVSQWISRGYGPRDERVRLPVAKREGRTVLLDPIEVAKADHATRFRARRAPLRRAA